MSVNDTGRFHPATFLYRLSILISAGLMLVGSYFAYDSIGALAPLIIEGLGVDREAIGLMYSFYSWPNVVMVFVGGFLIDRFGTKRMSLVFSALIVVGASLVAAAPTLGWMILGRTIFGIGSESLVVCQNAILAKWFKGKELAFAFGLALTFMRLGTLFSFNVEAAIAAAFDSWRAALWAAALLCGLSLLCNLVYIFLEKRAENRVTLSQAVAGDRIVLSDIRRFNASYWYIAILCLVFYSAIFPFTAFSTDFFVEKWNYSIITGGRLSGLIILASMVLAPILGRFVDKTGRRGRIMLAGSALLIPCYLLMGLTQLTPILPMILLGFAFSLVPAALWPAVPLIVEDKAVGTAFGLMTMIQNLGLAAVPWLIGYLRDTTEDYTSGMMVFAGLGVLAVIFAAFLRRADASAGSPLEKV